jgi:hypothetical protein
MERQTFFFKMSDLLILCLYIVARINYFVNTKSIKIAYFSLKITNINYPQYRLYCFYGII